MNVRFWISILAVAGVVLAAGCSQEQTSTTDTTSITASTITPTTGTAPPATDTTPSTTTSATPSTSAVPPIDPASAWAAVRSTLPQPAVESPVFTVDGTPTIATGVAAAEEPGSASTDYSVVVWEFTGSEWAPILSTDLTSPLDPAAFVVADLTGLASREVV